MKLPEIPDLTTALEQMAKAPAIKLAPGDRFIAQVDSVVIPAEVSKANGAVLLALMAWLPDSFEAIEEALSLILAPELISEEDRREAAELIPQIRSVREGMKTGLEKGFGGPLTPPPPQTT